MIYMRGQAADYDHWRQLGLAGWGWDDVLPDFLRAEDNERGASELHGAGGPLRVSENRSRYKTCEAFIEAAVQAGIPESDDFNGPEHLRRDLIQSKTATIRAIASSQLAGRMRPSSRISGWTSRSALALASQPCSLLGPSRPRASQHSDAGDKGWCPTR